jgi:hypothetical protein
VKEFVVVWGNGKVDRRDLPPMLADQLQSFVDSQRRSAPGTPCVIWIGNPYPLVASLHEQTAQITQNFENGEIVMRHTNGFPAADKAGDAS